MRRKSVDSTMISPPSRRSPRLSKQGIHATPPAKTATEKGIRSNGAGVGAGTSLDQRDTPKTKETNRIKTPDSVRVIPSLSTTTPTRLGRSRSVRISSSENVAAGDEIITRRITRATAAISPRTRGSKIASILASLGDLSASTTGTENKYVPPISLSSAEGTLHYLARAAAHPSKYMEGQGHIPPEEETVTIEIPKPRNGSTGVLSKDATEADNNQKPAAAAAKKKPTAKQPAKAAAAPTVQVETTMGNKQSLGVSNGASDDNSPPTARRTRRKRKAANAANNKFRNICEVENSDDLTDPGDLIEIGQKPSKKSKKGETNVVSVSAVGETIQLTSSSIKVSENHATAGTCNARRSLGEYWLRNFKKWASSQQDGSPTESALPTSPLSKHWVQYQRTQYRLRQQNKNSNMTQEKISLLESAGFCWKLQKNDIAAKTDSNHDDQLNNSVKRNKHEEKWLRNFKKWTSSQQDGSPTESAPTSPLSKNWVKSQRTQYRLRQQNKNSNMTQEKISLLESAGFCWTLRKNDIAAKTDSNHDDQLNDSVKKNKYEEKWLRNFKKWTNSQQDGSPTESAPASPLSKHWVPYQRTQYRLRQQNRDSHMTQHRISLLESAGFCWDLRKKNIAEGADSNHDAQLNDSVKKSNQSKNDTAIDEGGQKAKTQAKSNPTRKSLSKETSESTNESLSKRKSSRMRLQTQFYHDVETPTSSSDKGKDNETSKIAPSPHVEVKPSGEKQSQTTQDLTSASKTTAKNLKQRSPSKRSMSNLNNSLASLPTGVDAKKKSGKNKKRRGRHSMSSLSALEVPMKTSGKDGENDDVKGSVSFSHKELQQQLSKRKNRPTRKKPESGAVKEKTAKEQKAKTPIEHADGCGSENDSSIAKKPTSTWRESFVEKMDTKDVEDNKETKGENSSSVGKEATSTGRESSNKRSDTKNAKDNKEVTGENTSSVGKESSSTVRKSADGKSDGKHNTEAKTVVKKRDAPPLSPESPLRATKLLLSLSNEDSPKSNHAQRKSLGSDSTDKSTTNMSKVCIPKLLLSCLPEDSVGNAPPLSPESPLRATKLLPSLSKDDSPESNHAQRKSLGSDSTDKNTTDMSKVCVTKLLLSCLSEDTVEKDSAHAGPIPVEKRGTQSLSNKEASKETLGGHGTPPGSSLFSSDSKCPEKSLALDPIKGVDANNTRGESSSYKSNEQEIDFLPATVSNGIADKKAPTSTDNESSGKPNRNGPKESLTLLSDCAKTPLVKKKPTEIVGPQREKTLMAQSSQGTLAQEKKEGHAVTLKDADGQQPARHETQPAGCSPQPTHWTCDICQEATFENYDEAMAHERECAETYNPQAKRSSSIGGEEGDEASKWIQNDRLLEEQTKSTNVSKSFKYKRSSISRGSFTERRNLTDKVPNNERTNSWTCDVGQEATFEDYDEAVAHERGSASKKSFQTNITISNKERENTDASKRRKIKPPNQKRKKLIGKSISQKVERLSAKKGSVLAIPILPPKESINEPINSWTCDVCQMATFEDYGDAMAHERKCMRINRKNTQVEPPLSNEEEKANASKNRNIDPPPEEPEKPTCKAQRQKSKPSSSMNRKSAQQAQKGGWTRKNGESLIPPGGKNTNTLTKSSSFASNKPVAPSVSILATEMANFTKNSRHHKSKNSSPIRRKVVQQPQQEGDAGSVPAFFPLRNEESPIYPACGVDSNTQTEPSSSTINTQSAYLVTTPATDAANFTRKSKHHNTEDSSSIRGKLAHQPQRGGNAELSLLRNEGNSINPACGVDTNAQTEHSPPSSKKESAYFVPTPAVDVGSRHAPTTARKLDCSQTTPIQNKDQINAFSPLSLTSPLRADTEYNSKNDRSQYDSTKQIGNVLFPSYQLTAASHVQPTEPASKTETTAELGNPFCLGLVSQSFPSGARTSEPQLQMVVAEKRYQEKMAEFGRLELEAKMVTERMRELEEKINGLGSNTVFSGINSNRLEGYESTSRKITNHSESKSSSLQKSHFRFDRYDSSEEREYSDHYYSRSKKRHKRDTLSDEMESKAFSRRKSSRRAEEDTYERSTNNHSGSKSSSLQKSHSWSDRYDSSEEREYSDHYYSRSKKKQKRHALSEEMESKSFSRRKSSRRAEEDTYERSMNRVKVRSRSSRQEEGIKSRSSYDDSEIHIERSSSRRSTNVDRHHTERDSSPSEKYRSNNQPASITNGSKGGDSRKPSPFTEGRRSQASSPSKKPRGSKQKKKSPHGALNKSGYPQEEESHPRTRKPRGKSRNRCRKESDDSGNPTDERDRPPNLSMVKSNIVPMNEPTDDDDKDSEKGNVEANKKDSTVTVLNTNNSNHNSGVSSSQQPQQQQVGPRDPLYWLAGGENSSDDESWDFDGPMILPPPPL